MAKNAVQLATRFHQEAATLIARAVVAEQDLAESQAELAEAHEQITALQEALGVKDELGAAGTD